MYERDDLSSRLRRLLVERLELDDDPADIAAEANLRDELGFDSAGLLELVAGIEEEFGIEIDTEEITQDRFESIDSLARFVQAKT